MTHDDRPDGAAEDDIRRAAEWLRHERAVLARSSDVEALYHLPSAIAYAAAAMNDAVYAERRARILGEHERQREADEDAKNKERTFRDAMKFSPPSFDVDVARAFNADRAARASTRSQHKRSFYLPLETRAEKIIDDETTLPPEQRSDYSWAEFARDPALGKVYDTHFRTRADRTRFQAAETKLMVAAGGSLVTFFALSFAVGAPLSYITGAMFMILALAADAARRSNINAAIKQSRADLVWVEAIRKSVEHRYADRIKDNDIKRQLAERRATEAPAQSAPAESSNERDTHDGARAQRKATAAEVHEAYAHLQQEWGAYTLDREAFILTKPMLHVRAMPETRAYQDAMTALGDAVDDLGPDAPQQQIDGAAALAERAWQAWHDANDAAEAAGVDDCTATERAALDRLSKLVERIAHPSTPAIERANIVRDIERCMKLITTAPVAWSDLRVLPELADALPALPAPAPVATTGHQTVGEERSESLTEPSFTNGATS